MRYLVFDLETQNIFQEVGSNNVLDLDISVASFMESDTDTCHSFTVDELAHAWPLIERADALVGFNSNHFDIPLLNKYYPGDLTAIKSIDLLEAIKQALGRRVRLDAVAAATVGAKKSADGLAAVRWWREGQIEKIKAYCEQDVRVTNAVFQYARTNGAVRVKDGTKARDIPLDTADWDTQEGHSLTHALPF